MIFPNTAFAQNEPKDVAAPAIKVSVSSVINAVKCELAETFSKDQFIGKIIEPKIDASFNLKQVRVKEMTGEAGLEFDLGPATIGGTVGATDTRTSSSSLAIDFEYTASNGISVPAFCKNVKKSIYVKGDPFADILSGIKSEFSEIQAGEPKVRLKGMSYTVEFEVDRVKEAGMEVSLIIFKLGGGGSRGNTASQELTLKFEIAAKGDIGKLTIPM